MSSCLLCGHGLCRNPDLPTVTATSLSCCSRTCHGTCAAVGFEADLLDAVVVSLLVGQIHLVGIGSMLNRSENLQHFCHQGPPVGLYSFVGGDWIETFLPAAGCAGEQGDCSDLETTLLWHVNDSAPGWDTGWCWSGQLPQDLLSIA